MWAMELLPDVSAHQVSTDRLTMHWIESGPADGIPVLLVHGNLSTGRFYEHVLGQAPDGVRVIAPDMRGFGRTEHLPIQAARGLADWADDLASLLTALQIAQPVHLLGWSAGGLAIAQFAMLHGRAHPVASLTFMNPVSPYGYGGTFLDGRSCTPDDAGTGGGGVNPELVQRLRDQDSSSDSPFSIRNVIRGLYWNPLFQLPREREDLLVEEILMTSIGAGTYPGDALASPNWPGFAPGTQGILNALSPRYGRWDAITELDPKPKVLWLHGGVDLIVADGSPLELGTLGAQGVVPGWPGPLAYPPQPMVAQTRQVLQAYQDAGGHVQCCVLPSSGHGPHVDATEEWCTLVYTFITT